MNVIDKCFGVYYRANEWNGSMGWASGSVLILGQGWYNPALHSKDSRARTKCNKMAYHLEKACECHIQLLLGVLHSK